MISHNDEFVGALCPEQWHVEDGRLTSKGHLAVDGSRFEDHSGTSTPLNGAMSPRIGGLASGIASGLASGVTSGRSSAMQSAAGSEASSAVQSEAEGNGDDMKFRARKKKKLTKKQLKEREARRRLRHIEWLNSPKGMFALFQVTC